MSNYVTPEMLNKETQAIGSSGNEGVKALDQVEKILDKGLSIFEKVMALKKNKSSEGTMSQQIEAKSQKIVAMQQAQQQQQPQAIVYREPQIEYKTKELVEKLDEGIQKLIEKNPKKTLKEYYDVEVAQFKKSNMIIPFMDEMLKQITVIKTDEPKKL